MSDRPAIMMHERPPSALERRALKFATAPELKARANARAALSLIERAKRDVRRIDRMNLTEPERIARLLALDAQIAVAAARIGVDWQRGAFIKVKAK